MKKGMSFFVKASAVLLLVCLSLIYLMLLPGPNDGGGRFPVFNSFIKNEVKDNAGKTKKEEPEKSLTKEQS